MSEPTAEQQLEAVWAEVKHLRAVDAAAQAELERMQARVAEAVQKAHDWRTMWVAALEERDAARAELEALRADLVARAEHQEWFAGTNYPDLTDADRRMFRHAAAQLRMAAKG